MFSPYAERTKDELLGALRTVLPPSGLVVEIGSGSGQHVAHFAAALPDLRWQPTDRDALAIGSISTRCAGVPNVLPPLTLDVAADWPLGQADTVLAIDVLAVIETPVIERVFANAARILVDGGLFTIITLLAPPFARPVPRPPAHLAAWTVVVDPPTASALGALATRCQLDFVESRPLSGERSLLVFRRAKRSVASDPA